MNQILIKEWYEKYKTGIYRYSLMILGNPHSAEDVLQETFIKALKTPIPPNDIDRVQAWLYKIARNCCYDLLRKEKKEEISTKELKIAHSPSFAQNISEVEFMDMLANLKVIEIEIVSLHIVAGLTHKEIAKVMKLTTASTKKRYERAIHKLRKEFEEE